MSSPTPTKPTTSESSRAVNLHDSWLQHLQPEFDQAYMQSLSRFLISEKHAGKRIFPSGELIFNALNTTPLDKVKVVILGQDPYHGPNQAHGLSFSVPPGIAIPPSLRNIYQELHTDLGVIAPQSGHLQAWAEQGVLLLNAVLTVEAGQAASHQGKGWEQFTDAIVALLNQQSQTKVFMLWGSYAQKKGAVIDRQKHLVLKAPHPSPLSAHRGFFGCKHFSKANECLQQWGQQPINWQL
jgi:uracil-DNA glycosylase